MDASLACNVDAPQTEPVPAGSVIRLLCWSCGCQGNQVESAIKRYGDKDVRWSAQGMLRLMPIAMQRLYRPTLDAVSESISRILDNSSIQSTFCKAKG